MNLWIFSWEQAQLRVDIMIVIIITTTTTIIIIIITLGFRKKLKNNRLGV